MAKKRPDIAETARRIVEQATRERLAGGSLPPDQTPSNIPAPRGQAGGLKGGRARAKKLTAQQRRRIAKKAARARWAKRHDNGLTAM